MALAVRRLLAPGLMGVLASAVLGGLVASVPAHASSRTMSDIADRTYQTNGRVAAILTVGNTVFVGGDFTSVRPAGTAPGTGEVPRARLAAFALDTGALLSWNPGASKSVYALAASPDGRTVYVGGNFATVGSQPRRHVAALNATTGAVTAFVANTDRKVFAITPTASRIYLGGNFTTVNGQARGGVAAVEASGTVDSSWRPSTDGEVRAVALSPDGGSVYVGGSFAKVNGAAQKNLAKVTASAGTVQAWKTHPGYAIWSVVATADSVFVGGNGSGGHAGSYSVNGVRGWVTQTDGGVQAIALLDGSLYVGGHFDNVCVGDTAGATTGFHCPTTSATRHKLLAVDPSSGALEPWNPGANSPLGVFSLIGSGSQLYVGGDFTRVHSRAQEGYARFRAT
jgi:beta-propeller uncharacterized protein DUF5122